MTGSLSGIAASTSETWQLGTPQNPVDALESSFDFEVTWAWTSSPITISQSPLAPLIRADGLTGLFMIWLPNKVSGDHRASRKGWRQSSRRYRRFDGQSPRRNA